MTTVNDDEALLKSLHSSLCITWGTTAPYALGRVRCEKIGFASIPCVKMDVECRPEDVGALVPIVRQHVYRELAERGWTPDDVEFTPTVGGSYRAWMFVDENEASESHGRRKRGARLHLTFEMKPALARATFDPRVRPGQTGSFATLPDREGDAD